MTRNEVIRMAREAGISVYISATLDDGLERFAALVAAAEREENAKVCEGINSTEDYYGERVELVCADAIRARGQAG